MTSTVAQLEKPDIRKQLEPLNREMWRRRIWGVIDYQPHPKQVAAHEALARGAKYICDVWGRRSGKTIRKAASMVLEIPYGPTGQLPKRLMRITGPQFELTDPIFEYLWHWVVDKRIFGVEPIYKRADQRYFEMPWHSRVECKTTDNPKNLQGRGIYYTACDEHADDDPKILEQFIMPPTYDVRGVVDLGGTPKGYNNHLHKTYEEWAKRALTDPAYFTSHATSYDNPHIDHSVVKEYRNHCERMGMMDIFRQEVMAEFVSLAGAIYPMFAPMRGGIPWHVDENLVPVEGLPFTGGYDWGFNNPFVALLAQVTPDDRLLIHNIIYRRGMTDDECARAVLEWGITLSRGYADPSAPEAIQTFRRHGIPIYNPDAKGKAKINDVDAGISVVRSLLCREDKPGIVIHPRCIELIAELPGMVYSKSGDEKPVKENDHAPDALRYLAMGAIGSRRKGTARSVVGDLRDFEKTMRGYND